MILFFYNFKKEKNIACYIRMHAELEMLGRKSIKKVSWVGETEFSVRVGRDEVRRGFSVCRKVS